MLSCEKVLEIVYEYLDGAVDKNGVANLKEHLDLCRSCFGRVEFEKLLRDHIRQKTTAICPDRLKKRIQDLIDQF